MRQRAQAWAREKQAAGTLPQRSEVALTLLLIEGDWDRFEVLSAVEANGGPYERLIETLQMLWIAQVRCITAHTSHCPACYFEHAYLHGTTSTIAGNSRGQQQDFDVKMLLTNDGPP
jgi:hypothetical protein